MDKSVAEIAELVGGAIVGDAAIRITGVNGIRQAGSGDLSFVGSRQYVPYVETTSASALLIREDVVCPDKTVIRVNDPYKAFIQVIQQYVDRGAAHPFEDIHDSAVIGRDVMLGEGVAIDAYVRIADEARLGDGVVVYAGAYIGRGVRVGAETVIYPNVVLREGVTVGARCIVHAGVVVGSDGFGFAPMDGAWFKVPQVGTVVIGDDVEIGANSAVDRATFGSTVVGRGTKIDNLVQIGHNVEIGEGCVVSGMTGIAGSTTVGHHVTIGAQAGIGDHLEVGDRATIAGRAGVATSVKPGAVVSGYPAMDHQAQLRILAAMRRLPDTRQRVRQLERRVRELEEQLHG